MIDMGNAPSSLSRLRAAGEIGYWAATAAADRRPKT
jgi:hypothetical protein